MHIYVLWRTHIKYKLLRTQHLRIGDALLRMHSKGRIYWGRTIEDAIYEGHTIEDAYIEGTLLRTHYWARNIEDAYIKDALLRTPCMKDALLRTHILRTPYMKDTLLRMHIWRTHNWGRHIDVALMKTRYWGRSIKKALLRTHWGRNTKNAWGRTNKETHWRRRVEVTILWKHYWSKVLTCRIYLFYIFSFTLRALKCKLSVTASRLLLLLLVHLSILFFIRSALVAISSSMLH